MKFFEKVPLYPFLVAVYPILYLLAENKSETEPSSGLRSVLILLVAAGMIYLFSLLVTRNAQQGGMVTLVTLLGFFLVFFVLYAPAYRALREASLFGTVLGRHRILIPLTFFLLLGAALSSAMVVRKINPAIFSVFTLTGNWVAILLVLIPLITICIHQFKMNMTLQQAQADLPVIEQPLTSLPGAQPDVYYIIMDTLTSEHVWAELMGFNDQSFTTKMEEIGFYIPECSRSNYSSTQFSITSSLNFDYLPAISEANEAISFYPYMLSSRVRRMLEDTGYLTYAFETGYSFTNLTDADRYYKPVEGAWDLLTYPGVTPFESLIMRVSGGQILYESRDQLSQKMQYIIDASYVQYRERIVYTLETLPTLAPQEGPKFVFAHILAPHDPFVFDEDGTFTFRRTPFALNGDLEFRGAYGWDEYSVAYINELKYLQRTLVKVVEQIISQSAILPVIIIQGDHGIPRSAVDNAQFEIFNAIYIEGEQVEGAYSTLTPVNSFRFVFNQVFSTDYPLLDDEYYLYDKTTKSFIPFREPFPCP